LHTSISGCEQRIELAVRHRPPFQPGATE
jgi:hypothetical protein